MEYPKKGCDVGYFLSTGTNQNSITILRRSSVTKPCFLSIGLRSDRWQSAQIKDQADLHFLEKVISRCSVRCILGFRVLGFYWEYPKKGCDVGYFLRSKFNKIQLPFCDAQVSPNPVFCRSDWDRTGGQKCPDQRPSGPAFSWKSDLSLQREINFVIVSSEYPKNGCYVGYF